MSESRKEIVAWVGSNVVPHESDLRARLRRMSAAEDEIDDIIQEAYLRIARLPGVRHIQSGRAYFFTTAKSVVLERIRRDRIVRIGSLTEIDALALEDDGPTPEQAVSARQELERVRRLIAALPERCREIFDLRRIQGVPQRDVAERLGVPEHTVEAQTMRGLKLILQAIAGEGRDATSPRTTDAKRTDANRNG